MTTENASPVPAAPADLANLLVLAQLLKKDEELDARERERRDQDIRQALSESRNRQEHEPHLFWMQRVSAPEDAECIHAAVWHLNVALLVIGLLSGCTAILGIFFYDGTNRVSVWGVIGVFVGLQLFLIVGFAFAARSPVTRRASLAALMLSAARQAVRAIQRMLPEAGHGHHWVLEVLRPEHPYRTVAKWLVLHWSQSMAIAFNAAALVTAFALVVFTDLAFGWVRPCRSLPQRCTKS